MKPPRLPRRPESRRREVVVPVTSVASASRLLAEAGADADQAARSAGLDPLRFDDPTAKIGFAQVGRYLIECVRASRDDTFALRLGLTQGPSALNAVGYMAQQSPDVLSSLETLRTYGHIFAGGLTLSRERGLAVLECEFLLPRIEGAGLISEAAVGILVSVLRQLCGPAWNPLEVRMSRVLPPQPSRWRQCIGAPVSFGADGNLVVFSAKWLDQQVERADPELSRILHDRVAELDADDTIFETLLDRTRFEIACHLLENSAAAMTQIADLPGYAHPSALSRAFPRWANTSPRDWRAGRPAGNPHAPA